MKAFISGLLLALVVQYTYAQKAPVKFGDVPLEDLTMTTYSNDTSASAVVLADFGESSLVYSPQDGFVLAFERITRIKILTKDGLEWGDFTIPLYHDGSSHEKISSLKGVTYNLENGKVVETKMKNDAVFREMYDSNIELLKIAMPNVKVGSVVELTYRVTSDFLFNFQDWEFQYTIPVVWSEYRAKTPEYFSYDKYTQGYVPFHVNEHTTSPNSITLSSSQRSGGTGFSATQTTFSNHKIDFREDRYRWVAKDVPAFKAEPFMTTAKDYLSKINFELAYTKYPNQPIKYYTGTWEEVNKRYAESEDFGGEVTGNGFLKKIVEEITAGKNSPEEKIAALHDYVKTTISWNGANRKYISSSLKKVMEEKKGNSADINLLLASMLEKAGFAVFPVLISTRDNGFVRENIAISSQFNSVICLVLIQDKQLLLDATDKFLPLGLLPERCLNGNGLVIAKAGHSWVKLAAPIKSKTVVYADLNLEPEGTLKGKLKLDRSGYHAQRSRKNYFTKGEPDYIKEFSSGHSWELSKSEFQNPTVLHEVFKESHDLSIPDHVTATGDMIYLNPFVHSKQDENPFKLEKREYPVDFGYAFDDLYFIKVTIPEGYVVDELPKAKAIALPENASRYSYNATQIGNVISITSNLQINKSLFTQPEYPHLREFYDQVVAKQAEQIVLKKKQ